MKTSPFRSKQGIALIIVLSFVVLVAALVIAFLTRAQTNRQIASVSSGGTRADSIAKAALNVIVTDLKDEIRTGSSTPVTATQVDTSGDDTVNTTVTYYPPRDKAATQPYRSVPHSANYASLIKISTPDPFFEGTGSFGAEKGPRRGTGSSATASGNGRAISAQRWAKPGLSTGDIPSPAWVYVTTSGEIGTAGTTPFSDTDTDILKIGGTDPAVGRFAYAIYNVGGLLDINVVGNELAAGSGIPGNEHRGWLHQADLTTIPGMSAGGITALLGWRNPSSKSVGTTADDSGSLFDPKRDFIKANNSGGTIEQMFLTRQDLLNYVSTSGSGITTAALPYLTIFSREKNAPTWQSAASSTPPLNLGLAATAKLKKRFPLSRIRLLDPASATSNAADIMRYFGLIWDEDARCWVYRDSARPLSEIASLSTITGREPDFFEILKSVIAPTSLGTLPVDSVGAHSSSGLTAQQRIDAQVFQIGVNIIDAYDTDVRPMDIFVPFSTVKHAPANRFFGMENLPYIRRVGAAFQSQSNSPNPDTITGWLTPEIASPYGKALNDMPNIRLRLVGDAQMKVDGNLIAAGAKPFTAASHDDADLLNSSTVTIPLNFDGLTATATSGWIGAGGVVNANPTASGIEIGTDNLPVGSAAPPKYGIEAGNGTSTLTFILEYEADSGDFRPYAIWHGLKATAGSNPARLEVDADAATGVYAFRPADFPVWMKEADFRTERSAIVLKNFSDPMTPLASAFHLDRPFRSAGELGYVFRDTPNQNIRFEVAASPDAALLDFFSVNDSEVLAGKISMSTRVPQVLKAMLVGAATDPDDTVGVIDGDATPFANAIVALNTPEPAVNTLQSRGELVNLFAGMAEATTVTGAPVRSLGEVANTRTWNLMIDVIAQTGRIPRAAEAADSVTEKFMVEGERRYWLHIAIDRYTGEVVGDPIVELVTE